MTKDFFLETLARIVPDEKGCKNWPFSSMGGGYGCVRLNRKMGYAHRIAYKLLKNPDLDETNLMVRHTCDNRMCVNSEHLIEGTSQDNVNDMLERGGHTYVTGELHGKTHITDAQIQEIKVLYATGNYTQWDLATKYKVKQATISGYVRDKYRQKGSALVVKAGINN